MKFHYSESQFILKILDNISLRIKKKLYSFQRINRGEYTKSISRVQKSKNGNLRVPEIPMLFAGRDMAPLLSSRSSR